MGGLSLRSIVIPAFNEEGSIKRTLDAVLSEVSIWEHYEVIVCDNASTDKTVERVREVIRSNPNVTILEAKINGLYAWNVKRGIAASSGDRIFILDGDGQYPPKSFHQMDAFLDEGFDLVLGYREKRVGGLIRILASYTYLFLCKVFIGFKLHDINAGARAISRRLADVLDIRYLDSMVNPEIYASARHLNFRIGEVSVGHELRVAGETSHAFSRPLHLFWQSLKYLDFLRKTYK